jgi:hypothetical protein
LLWKYLLIWNVWCCDNIKIQNNILFLCTFHKVQNVTTLGNNIFLQQIGVVTGDKHEDEFGIMYYLDLVHRRVFEIKFKTSWAEVNKSPRFLFYNRIDFALVTLSFNVRSQHCMIYKIQIKNDKTCNVTSAVSYRIF